MVVIFTLKVFALSMQGQGRRDVNLTPQELAGNRSWFPPSNSWASDIFSGKEMLKFLALKFKNQSINEVKPYEPQVERRT